MPFKEKANKKIIVNKEKTVTLDSKHNEKLKEFENDEKKIIPDLETKITKLTKKIRQKNIEIEEKLNLKDEIRELKQKIKKVRAKKKDYFLNNSKYVFEYFESKKNISEGQSKKVILNSYFNVSKNEKKVDEKMKNNVQSYLENMDTAFLDVNNFVTQNSICKSCYDGELIPIEHEGVIVCNK